MVDDKLVRRSLWVGDIQRVRIAPTIFPVKGLYCSSINYPLIFKQLK